MVVYIVIYIDTIAGVPKGTHQYIVRPSSINYCPDMLALVQTYTSKCSTLQQEHAMHIRYRGKGGGEEAQYF